MTGRKMLNRQEYLLKGHNKIKIADESLEAGLYIITLECDKKVLSSKALVR